LSAFFGSYSIGYFTSPLINKTPNFCHCFENPIKYPPGKIEAEKLPPPLDIQSPQLEGVHGGEMLFKLSTVAEIKIKTAFSSANGGVCRKFESFVRNLEGFAPPPPPEKVNFRHWLSTPDIHSEKHHKHHIHLIT
jgi:hypothetical protein